jgi:uncharacterized RDD family membrane protein YckC
VTAAAAAVREEPIDTAHRVQTPEGVELVLHVAGPAPRGFAWLVDSLIEIAAVAMLSLGLNALTEVGFGLVLIIRFALAWFYPVAFEVLAGGRTPGKGLLGLQVVHEDGTPVRLPASVLRNFLRVVDALPIGYLLGLTAMCADPAFRRLGDSAAGTLVVHARQPGRRRAARKAAAARPAQPAGPPLPPPIPLSLDEQRAVIAFAERAGGLTDERARELAAIPEPLVRGLPPREALERMAAWLLGRPA